MLAPVEDTTFSFVNYDGPKLSRSPSVRRAIKQQAMRDVGAARRRRGDYGQHNLRQYPVFLEPTRAIERWSTERIAEDTASGIVDTARRRSDGSSIQGRRRRSISALVTRHSDWSISAPGFNPGSNVTTDLTLLLKLMPLTGLRLGIATLPNLIPEAARTGDFFPSLQLGSRRLLSFIPSRYSHVSSLRCATDCVVAKLRQILQNPTKTSSQDGSVLVLYNQALRALQRALEDENEWMSPETLCATELLGVYEVLNGSSDPTSWIRHVAGAARLIEVRGPQRFKTDFERALFMAYFGPIVMHCFLSNTPCFLADDKWKEVVRSAVYEDESLSDQRDLALSLWSSLLKGPQLFKDTTDVIFSPTPPPQTVINDLIKRLLRSREGLIAWMDSARKSAAQGEGVYECGYGFALPRLMSDHGNISPRHITWLALRGTNIVCRMIKARLAFALDPLRNHDLEIEAQDLASRVLNLKYISTKDQRGKVIWSMFMAQSTWVAKGIIETKDLWNEGWETRPGMIEKWKFEVWSKAIGRKLPSL